MRRALLVLLAIAVLVPLAALATTQFVLTPAWLRARAEEAVLRATGRSLTIAGPVRLAWSLAPTLVAEDVSLANPPGMSRPAMAHVGRVEARVAMLPLLSRRIELERVVLTGPDLLLERDAAGRPNWDFARPPSAAPATASAPSRVRMALAVGTVAVTDARIGWRGADRSVQGVVPRLDYAPATNAVSGAVAINGVTLALDGTAGPVAGADWPLNLHLAGGGVVATIAGTTSRSAVSLLAPELAAASALAGQALPDLRDVQARLTVSAAGIADVHLGAGPGQFGALRLLRASLSAPDPDQPARATAELAVGALPIAAAVNAGSLRALFGRGPIALQVRLLAEGAVLSGEGSVADLRGDGLQMTVTGEAPDLGRLGASAGMALPPLRDVAVDMRIAGDSSGLLIRGLRLRSSAGDLAGDFAAGLVPRPYLRGTLAAQRIDLDGLAPHAAPAVPTAPPTQPPAPPSAASAVPSPVIPDTPLPFAALRRMDADLHLSAGEAVWRGVSYRSVDARLLLESGALRLDPMAMQGPGGPMHGRVEAEATPAAVSVSLQAPGLAAGPVLALLGAPEFSSGTVDLDIQLQGRGETLRALASTLSGHAGAAMVDGEVDNRWLADLLGNALRAANLPAEASGQSRVRCAAIRAEAASGQVRLQSLTLDTSKLKLDGEGEVNLANETLALHLRPQLRLGALLSVPVRVSGTFRAPKAALDPGALSPGRIGLTIGGAPAPDTCGAALALARGGRPGPLPTAPVEPPGKPARPADLLRGMFR